MHAFSTLLCIFEVIMLISGSNVSTSKNKANETSNNKETIIISA
jgi:hypothetical protein